MAERVPFRLRTRRNAPQQSEGRGGSCVIAQKMRASFSPTRDAMVAFSNAASQAATRKEAPMRRLVLKPAGKQYLPVRPAAGESVIIGVDLARSKWVYACRWSELEQRRLSTPGEICHLQALAGEYRGEGCRVHIVYEACGFGYEIARWAQAQGLDVLVVPPSTVE